MAAPGGRTRGRVVVAAGAAALLLTGCGENAEEAARREAERRAVEAARQHNAVAGGAILLLAVLLIRLLARFVEDQPGGWHAHRRAPLPPLLMAGALSGEVLASAVFVLIGAGAGYVFGNTPPDPDGINGLVLLMATVLMLPVAGVAGTGAVFLWRLPKRLPDVSGSTFFIAAVLHVVAGVIGLGIATDPNGAFDGWNVVGAVIAGEGALGAVAYGYGVVVRRRQTREARALRRV
jgi:hypothetical protein